jgi:hypothetical protein
LQLIDLEPLLAVAKEVDLKSLGQEAAELESLDRVRLNES